jgi:hypothetical protein
MKKTHLADDYLNIKAQMAALAEAEGKLKIKLIALGGEEFEGKIGRVTISKADGRTTFDADLLKKHVPAATLDLCKKQGAPSLRFNVTSRLAKSKIAA